MSVTLYPRGGREGKPLLRPSFRRVARPGAVLACLALLALGVSEAAADEVVLKDGRRLTGKVFEAGDDRVRIVMRHGSLELERSEIRSIEEAPTPEEVYAGKASKLGDDDLEGHLDLARWCKAKRLDREERWELERVLEIDPDHAEAREGLGFVRHEDEWITADEHRERTRYPWVRPMRERLGRVKVDLSFERAPLMEIVLEFARKSGESFRLLKLEKLEKFRMTYRCEQRPALMVLEDLVKHVPKIDYCFAEDGVVITSPREAKKMRREYGMPAKPKIKTREDVLQGIRGRHLTLLVVDRPLPWVLRYIETLSGFGIVVEAELPETPTSYQCTAEPLGTILQEILAPRGLRYEVVGSSIVVRRR